MPLYFIILNLIQITVFAVQFNLGMMNRINFFLNRPHMFNRFSRFVSRIQQTTEHTKRNQAAEEHKGRDEPVGPVERNRSPVDQEKEKTEVGKIQTFDHQNNHLRTNY